MCSCGSQKLVATADLLAGKIRTCGATACRYPTKYKTRVRKGYRPRGSFLSERELRQVIKQIKTTPARQIALTKGWKPQTLYSVLRAVREAGGLERYLKLTGGL